MAISNKTRMKQFYENVINAGRLDLLDEYVAPSFVEHEGFPGLPPGREGLRQFFGMMRTAFPDLKFVVHDLIADGNKVAARLTMTGTHRGEFAGIKATRRKISIDCIDIIRIRNGKAVEHWGVSDQMALMQRLGAIPSA